MQKIEIFENENEIKKQVDDIFEFLKVVHPTAMEDTFQNPIEIRFLHRDAKGTTGLHSANLFGLNEKSKEQLMKKIVEYSKKTVCVYFSGYKYNYYYECEVNRRKRNGQKYTIQAKPMKIKKESALGTQILPMDFDNMDHKEFLTYKNILNSVGIEVYTVFSGHGYQAHILLDKYYEDPTLFEQFTNKLQELNFPIDAAIVDPSRVLRLPYTVNYKDFDRAKNPFKEPVAIHTKVFEKTDKRYSVEFVFAKLDELIEARQDENSKMVDEFFDAFMPGRAESGSGESSPATKKVEKQAIKKAAPKEKSKKSNENLIKTENYFADAYKYVDFKHLQHQIKHILMGVPEGVRNDAMLFLIPFLKNELNLTLEKATETLLIWGENCSPALTSSEVYSDVARLWRYDIKATYGRYTKSLEDVYGKLDILHGVVSDRQVKIENKMFQVIGELEGAALKVYLTMKLLEKEEQKHKFTKEEIATRAEISDSTFKRAMKPLVSTALVNKKSSVHKQAGENILYSIHTLGSEVYGYTKIETATIELMILKNLSKYEIAFYVYMCAKTWSSTENLLYVSQNNIAEAIGKASQSAISKITDNLHKMKFIYKTTYKLGNALISQYKLLK